MIFISMRKRHWKNRKNRKCPDCSRMLTYTRKDSFDRAVGNNSVCKSCAQADRKLTLKTIEKMKVHEIEHCQFFENEIKKRNIKPTKFLPLWDLLGVSLGFGSTLLGKKAAMLCTASVEEVIDSHYQNQINQLNSNEKKLREKIIKFREDELKHKDIAYEKGATKSGIYSILDKIIKTGSKIAINVSEKI